jgi:ABC-type branched-subunit amino acid transport system ATPase component
MRAIAEIHQRGMTVLPVEQNAHMALNSADWDTPEGRAPRVRGERAMLLSDERIRGARLSGPRLRAPK